MDTTAAIRDCEMHAFKKLKSEVRVRDLVLYDALTLWLGCHRS